MGKDEIETLFENAIVDGDFERVKDLIHRYDKDVEGGGKDFAFRLALHLESVEYIEYSIEEIDLNDAGEFSTFFEETENSFIQEILYENGAEYPPQE